MYDATTHHSFHGPRSLIATLAPHQQAQVAGRVERRPQAWLRDASGAVPLEGAVDALEHGDLVALRGVAGQGAFFVQEAQRYGAPLPGARPEVLPVEALRRRAGLYTALRAWFVEQGFVEVETPNLVQAPGMDLHLDPFATSFSGMGEQEAGDLYLHTSPEFLMKRLLSQGMERIFQICKVYRNGEWTARHHPEFTMVEWYRAWADYEPIMQDVAALVHLAFAPWPGPWAHQGRAFSPLAPPERLTVQEAFVRHCRGLDILAEDTAPRLRQRAQALGLGPLLEGGSWEDLFHELLVTWVEPELGWSAPCFLVDYPRSLAVLSRVKDADPRVAERFELYIAGVELCNGFTELTDPREQRARFEEELEARGAAGMPALPMPERFLGALAWGMPPSGGVALGLDRLLMLSMGAQSLDEVLIRA